MQYASVGKRQRWQAQSATSKPALHGFVACATRTTVAAYCTKTLVGLSVFADELNSNMLFEVAAIRVPHEVASVEWPCSRSMVLPESADATPQAKLVHGKQLREAVEDDDVVRGPFGAGCASAVSCLALRAAMACSSPPSSIRCERVGESARCGCNDKRV